MTTKITINDKLVEAAEAALKQVNGLDEAVSITADGMTSVLSPNVSDLLAALHIINHAGSTYYLGLPSE